MTNYDNIHKKSLSEMAEFLSDVTNDCTECCIDCNGSCLDCKERIIQWLNQEVKPTLSEAEKVILENIDKDYKWIARDEDNSLWLYGDRPIKKCTCWSNEESEIGEEFAFYKHLFQFITWQDDEPYNIEELLKGE